MATGDWGNKAIIYDKIKDKIYEFKHDGIVNSVSFSNDGRLLAAGDCAKKTIIYDVTSKAKLSGHTMVKYVV